MKAAKRQKFHCLRRAAINRRHRAAQMFLRHTDALISAPGTVPVVVHNIPIFDGITTIQPVALSFDVSGARRDEAESITDTEPNL